MFEFKKPLPQYFCHKRVGALKIAQILFKTTQGFDGEYHIFFDKEEYNTLVVDVGWFRKHTPQVGGYIVQYEDGYVSYSPARPFETGYTLDQT